jgi:hypothetical protein
LLLQTNSFSTTKQLKLQRLPPNFLQGSTVVKLYKHLQLKAQNGFMELLISAPSVLISNRCLLCLQIFNNRTQYLSKSTYGKAYETTKFFQFIKFSAIPNFWSELFDDAKY